MIRRGLNVTGRTLFAVGVVVLLFTAYQLWGTGVLESHSQQALRSQLDHQLPPGATARANRQAQEANEHPLVLPHGTATDRVAPPAAAPGAGDPVAILQIPSIGLDQVVVEGVGTDQLRLGPGHYPGTPLPGEAGNVAIAGHRTTYGHPFYNLNAVANGGQIILTTRQGIFVYASISQEVISPSDNSVLDPTADTQTSVLTLTTCNPRYSASQRLVLRADMVQSYLFDAKDLPVGPPSTSAGSGSGSSRSSTGTSPTAGSDDLAGQGQSGDFLPAVLWALATLTGALGVWLLARRMARPWRVYLPGALGVLVLLFVFFVSVSPLLPASF